MGSLISGCAGKASGSSGSRGQRWLFAEQCQHLPYGSVFVAAESGPEVVASGREWLHPNWQDVKGYFMLHHYCELLFTLSLPLNTSIAAVLNICTHRVNPASAEL